MRLLIVGPPGAGKGTQATRLAASLGVPAISTGDIFRANVRDGTELGLLVQSIMKAGDYVPDTITNLMVRDRLAQADVAPGFILDGYPRTEEQVHELDMILAERSEVVRAVLHLVVDADELVGRLTNRATEEGRADDHPDAVRHRLAVYEAQTAPIVDLYAARGLVRRIDGLGSQDEVAKRMVMALVPQLETS